MYKPSYMLIDFCQEKYCILSIANGLVGRINKRGAQNDAPNSKAKKRKALRLRYVLRATVEELGLPALQDWPKGMLVRSQTRFGSRV